MVLQKPLNIEKYGNHSNSLRENLKTLINIHSTSEAELARKTAIPQATLNKILLGNTEDPRASTLRILANFFDVTIGQIIGVEPLNLVQNTDSIRPFLRQDLHPIPVIEWNKLSSWIFERKVSSSHVFEKWVVTEQKISDLAFAVKSQPFMQPVFRENSILIIDPKAEQSDGSYIIVSIDGCHPTIRKLSIDGGDTYLTPIQFSIPPSKWTKNHKLVGVIVEEKLNHSS